MRINPVWDPTFLPLIQVVLINSPDPQWAIFDQGANGFGGTSHAVPARDTLQFLCRSQQSPESERGIRIEDDRSPPIDLLYQENAARMMIPKESCLPPVPASPSSDMCGHPYRCIFIAEIHSHAIYPAGWSDFKSSKGRRKRKIAMVKIEDNEEMQTEGRAIHGCCLLNQRKCNLTQDTPKVIEFVLNANIEGKLSSPSNFVNSRFRKLSNMFLPVATSWSGFCHTLILMLQAEHRLQRGTFAVPTSDSTWNHHLLG